MELKHQGKVFYLKETRGEEWERKGSLTGGRKALKDSNLYISSFCLFTRGGWGGGILGKIEDWGRLFLKGNAENITRELHRSQSSSGALLPSFSSFWFGRSKDSHETILRNPLGLPARSNLNGVLHKRTAGNPPRSVCLTKGSLPNSRLLEKRTAKGCRARKQKHSPWSASQFAVESASSYRPAQEAPSKAPMEI